MRQPVAILLALVVLAVLPTLAAWAGSPATVPLATRILIYGIAAASLNFALGYGGMISFGHAAFFGIGGYVVAILFTHWFNEAPIFGLIPGTNQLLITLPLAIVVSGLFAAAIGALSLRTGGVQFIMITLAFAQMLFFLFVSLKAYGGEDGLSMRRPDAFLGLNLRDRPTMYYLTLVITVLFFAGLRRLVRSSFGTVLDGIRQNERRMEALGIATYRHKLFAFILSGMGVGMAGALMANAMRYVSPDMMHWSRSGELMIMVILGGTGTLLGPLYGAAALLLLETWLAGWTEHWSLGEGLVLLAVVMFSRGGLIALLRRRT
ncbi:branched-chain amino acid ABC transporter permease [Frigidibacter sp. ROC022]|uniref:branched-chain amino acid ABC transporter permease n=1 Tax=Frigidibacter sp. ROC022 TaxID=2971796 RepID=UPI00215B466C|nr:branched-chain amino acid ABC transporter permease [Frigidibacter sp. ROC022]MCR8726721.1 branched-chain amino acid ABC transporter permease [Frigidibacter sp. ROC022]